MEINDNVDSQDETGEETEGEDYNDYADIDPESIGDTPLSAEELKYFQKLNIKAALLTIIEKRKRAIRKQKKKDDRPFHRYFLDLKRLVE